MNRTLSTILLAFPLGSLLHAQSLTLSAPVPIVVSSPVPPTSATLPAGPMVSIGSLFAGGTGSVPNASFAWQSATDPSVVYYQAFARTYNPVSGPASLAIDPGEVLLSLAAPTTMQVEVLLRCSFEIPTGGNPPQLLANVYDDALVELTTPAWGNEASAMLTLTIGPAPTPIRTRVGVSQTVTGISLAQLEVIATPRSNCTTSRLPVGCDNGYGAVPTFSGDVLLIGSPQLNSLVVGVLGTGIQPLPLGQSFAPCTLFPTINATVLFSTWSSTTLVIPAAARPLQFWTQGVVLRPSQVTVTELYLVNAF